MSYFLYMDLLKPQTRLDSCDKLIYFFDFLPGLFNDIFF